jgi:hypothetical protein
MASRAWIVGKRYDLAFIFGGAAASLLAPALALQHPLVLPVLFWGWLFAFDGTHMWAAYSRTYVDRSYWAERPRLLRWSLLVFAAPVAAVALALAGGSPEPVNLFLFAAQSWGYYHIVRQHYGFLSLYDRRAGADARTHRVNTWALYVGLWVPYLYFLAAHPFNRVIASLPPVTPAEGTAWSLVAGALTAATLAAAAAYHVARRRAGPAEWFLLVCIALYSAIFYGVARLEPLFGAATERSVIETFMLVQVMVTLFHNVQYHALVWHYNRTKYGREGDFGWARRLNRGFTTYVLVGLLFSVGYIAIATATSGARVERLGLDVATVAFCLWWGVALHHYYLDQKIWRVSTTPDLRAQLGVTA